MQELDSKRNILCILGNCANRYLNLPNPNYRGENGDFLYNGFNGQFNSIPYNDHKLI